MILKGTIFFFSEKVAHFLVGLTTWHFIRLIKAEGYKKKGEKDCEETERREYKTWEMIVFTYWELTRGVKTGERLKGSGKI